MNKKILQESFLGLIIAFMFILAVSFLLSPCSPERIPTHWNMQGEIDGWSNKYFGLLLLPVLSLIVWVLMLALPLFDPLKKNYHYFARFYFLLKFWLISFLAVLFILTIIASLGINFEMYKIVVPFFAVFLIFCGYYLPQVKKNYFVGIKTPWTIHSENVWNKTHKFAGKVFLISGIIAMQGIWFSSQLAFQLFLISIIFASIIPIVYSYLIFKKEKKYDETN